MKKQGMWAIVSVLVALGLVLASCAKAPAPTAPATPTAPAAPAAEKPAPPKLIKLRSQASAAAPPVDRFVMSADIYSYFKEMVEAQFPGRVEVELAPVGSLYPDTEILQSLQKGLVQWAGLWGGFFTAVMPEANVSMGLPFAWEQASDVTDAFVNLGLDDYMHEIYLNEWNVWSSSHFGMGALQGSGGYTFMANSPADLKGRKIRAVGVWQKWLGKLGGSGVVVGYADMYMALKLGTIEGIILSIPALDNIKAKEVLKSWVVYPNQSDYGLSIAFNLDAFNALPEDVKTFLNNISPFIMSRYMEVRNHNFNRWVGNRAEKDGYIKLIRWSEEDTKYTRGLGYEIWDEIAALSPRTARGVEIVRKQQRDYGRM